MHRHYKKLQLPWKSMRQITYLHNHKLHIHDIHPHALLSSFQLFSFNLCCLKMSAPFSPTCPSTDMSELTTGTRLAHGLALFCEAGDV